MDEPQILVQYRCRSCRSICINDHREDCTRYRECWDCHAVPDLDSEPIDNRLPGLLWAFHFVLVEDSSSSAALSKSGVPHSGTA